MRFTVITPTIAKPSLIQTVKSVLAQDYKDFEYLVVPDVKKHNDYGSSVRRDALANAKGEYILYIDDDDLLLEGCLAEIDKGLKEHNDPTFLIFPTLRLGKVFFNNPPGFCRTTSSQYVHKRTDRDGQPILFPGGDYGVDSRWIEEMTRKYDYVMYDPGRPLTEVPVIGGKQR